jgi:hypothetical protein
MGTPGFPRNTSNGTPRALFTKARRFTVSVWSYDPTAPDDEGCQIAANDSLEEMVLAGLVAAANGSVKPGGETYQDDLSWNLPLGIELLVPLILDEPRYGLPPDVITEVSAEISTEFT